MCDFQRSFYTWRIDKRQRDPVTVTHDQPFTINHVRVPMECRCELRCTGTGEATVYGLGAACKTERVNVARDIWTQPNADFHPVGTASAYLRIKHWDHRERQVMLYPPSRGIQPKRQVGLAASAYVLHRLDIVEQDVKHLETTDDIIHAVLRGSPIVARTEFKTRSRYEVVLDYPIKTINVSDIDAFYQVDTGPVLVPDLEDAFASPLDGFRLAYIAHNAPDWAELLLNVPTNTGGNVCVDHYSQAERIDARNAMFEVI